MVSEHTAHEEMVQHLKLAALHLEHHRQQMQRGVTDHLTEHAVTTPTTTTTKEA